MHSSNSLFGYEAVFSGSNLPKRIIITGRMSRFKRVDDSGPPMMMAAMGPMISRPGFIVVESDGEHRGRRGFAAGAEEIFRIDVGVIDPLAEGDPFPDRDVKAAEGREGRRECDG